MRHLLRRAEAWLPVPGHHGYEVSSLGRVRSLIEGRSRQPRERPRILRLSRNRKTGYCYLNLGAGRTRNVHTLVLLAFVGARPVGFEAAHGNGVPDDNRIENLCWKTHTDNEADKRRHGTLPCGESHWTRRRQSA